MSTTDEHAADVEQRDGTVEHPELTAPPEAEENGDADLPVESWPGDGDEGDDALLSDGVALFARWEQIQGRFVDEPRRAVEEADALVGHVVHDLSQAFAGQRERLEQQWKAGDDVSTEDLRRALQRYRAFFRRLAVV